SQSTRFSEWYGRGLRLTCSNPSAFQVGPLSKGELYAYAIVQDASRVTVGELLV
ncbi:MAG: hypothetical protein ACI8W7_002142, partial [Gammaproteobacteria bacterium]